MHASLEKLGRVGIVPVMEIDRGEDAFPLGNALPECIKVLSRACFWRCQGFRGARWCIQNGKVHPYGCITPQNLREYLRLPSVLACGGSWRVKTQWISAGEFERITPLAAEAVGIVKQVRER